MAFTYSLKNSIALGLRAALLAWTFSLFICSCVALGKLDFWENRTGVSLVTSLLGFIYYIPTVLPVVARHLSPATALAGEVWMLIWWIIAVGVLGDRFGSDLTCSYAYGRFKTGCQAGKAGLAFAVLGFVFSLATVAIIGFFSVYKAYRDGGKLRVLERGLLSAGAIFLSDSLSSQPSGGAAGTEDTEAAAGASSGQEEAVDHKDVESQPTEHSPVTSPAQPTEDPTTK
uniref:MARVEL domain-containing protein n=1 Tax=Candidozyma auris TaxID=498019 RepID=A0A0L0NWT2_CANAR